MAEGAAGQRISVGLFGNVANALFEIGRALCASRDITATLYISDRDPATSRPESTTPTLERSFSVEDGPWITPRSLLLPSQAAITRRLATHDVIIVSGPGPIFAQWTGQPWYWWVSGGDLTIKPFPIRFRSWYPNLVHRVGEVVAGGWQRRAARRATELWVQPFAPMRQALDELRVPAERVASRYLPLPIDVDEFSPGPPAALSPRIDGSDFVVFHPSRLVFRDDPLLRRAGQLKGNDVLIRGFAAFVAMGRASDPLLVMPDTSMSRDLEEARSLIAALGIEDHVEWAQPPQPGGFTRSQLLDYYRRADVVGAEWSVGWFGFVALEGLATATPVIAEVDEAAMAVLYPGGHPIVAAATPDEVAAALRTLHADRPAALALGERGRTWVLEHHAKQAVASTYRDVVAEVLDQSARSERQ